jgi:hypothetical protein
LQDFFADCEPRIDDCCGFAHAIARDSSRGATRDARAEIQSGGSGDSRA